MLQVESIAAELERIACVQAEAEEAAARRLANAKWLTWLHEGPGDGIGRQHKMTRTSTGWIETAIAEGRKTALPQLAQAQDDDFDGLTAEQLEQVMANELDVGAPANAQQETDNEAATWGKQWLSDDLYVEPQWPENMGRPPVELQKDELVRACMTFPAPAGFGWDAIHPRAIPRLSTELIKWIVLLLLKCELSGAWPTPVGVCIVVLLPKADGGFRPIGLLPWMVRVWTRSRREAVSRWEAAVHRPFLYAGKAMGADIAAWKQAARAELVATASHQVGYGIALLDLVKAFERVPHWLLVNEAVELGFPLWILRLSLAAYRLPRTLRVGRAFSYLLTACRGIVAGSGFATAEMKLIMIRLIEKARRLAPMVVPTLFVDDIGAEVMGPAKVVIEQLPKFVKSIAKSVTDAVMELSGTKCVCNASTDKLGRSLQENLKPLNVKYQKQVKSLGVGLAGGRRRCSKFLKKRLLRFKFRTRKFRTMQAAGTSAAKLFRTGGKASMTYGEAINRVSDSLLRDQRRTAAVVTAPAAGGGGQNIDLALTVADGSRTGRADPAYDAHDLPLGQWATSVWEGWLPKVSLLKLAASAKKRLIKAQRMWAVVYGPAAAMVASCGRLGWTVLDGFNLITDLGRGLNLAVDPPAVVRAECREAVQRWRWRNVSRTLPQLRLNGMTEAAVMQPIWGLLGSKRNDDQWNSRHRAYLQSVIANRQWPQVRLKAAGLALHDRCMLCLQGSIEAVRALKAARPHDHEWFVDEAKAEQLKEHPTEAARKRAVDKAATEMLHNPHPKLVEMTPVGSLMHRAWACPSHDELRNKCTTEEERRQAKSGCCEAHPAWTRALTPMPMYPPKAKAKQESFHWHTRPTDESVKGKVYTDGSLLDGPDSLTARCSWSFVVLDGQGEIEAAAYGVTPPWVVDIHGAEVWALLQASSLSLPGTARFYVDCESVVKTVQAGSHKAAGADKVHARVYTLLFAAIDDVDPSCFIWMPAHQREGMAKQRILSDGTLLTIGDIRGNDHADTLAKKGVQEHRVDKKYVQDWAKRKADAKAKAMWLAKVTEAANNMKTFPHRDAEGSRVKANDAATRRKAQAAKSGKGKTRMPREVRPPQLGGHILAPTPVGPRTGWRCSQCKVTSTSWAKLAHQQCSGSAVDKWASEAAARAEAGVAIGSGHSVVLSGEVAWCTECGSYANAKAIGLSKPCKGAPCKNMLEAWLGSSGSSAGVNTHVLARRCRQLST